MTPEDPILTLFTNAKAQIQTLKDQIQKQDEEFKAFKASAKIREQKAQAHIQRLTARIKKQDQEYKSLNAHAKNLDEKATRLHSDFTNAHNRLAFLLIMYNSPPEEMHAEERAKQAERQLYLLMTELENLIKDINKSPLFGKGWLKLHKTLLTISGMPE